MSQVVREYVAAPARDSHLGLTARQAAKLDLPPGGRRSHQPPARALAKLAAGRRQAGVITNLKQEKGFAFILADSGTQYFVHITSMRDRSAWKEGARVSFIAGVAPSPNKAAPALGVEPEAPCK